jgi:hypothetical protein
MEYINELSNSLKVYLGWHKSRLDCVAQIIFSLLITRTVNLSELSTAFKGKAKQESSYIRLKRFFRGFVIDYDRLAEFIFWLFVEKDKKCYLTIDRTNWYFGSKKINIFMLAITYRGIAIPIFWRMLPKKGNTNTCERIELLNRFIKVFGKEIIGGILADREFIGDKWFGYLRANEIPFYIRIKKSTVVRNKKGKTKNAWQLFLSVPKMEIVIAKGTYVIYGQSNLKLSGMRLEKGDFLIIATPNDVANAIEIYAQRWEIETLFGCLKTKGFCLEQTRLTSPERLEKLVAVLAIAFAWAYKVGIWSHENNKAIALKKHGRKQCSFFKYGLDKLRHFLLTKKNAIKEFFNFLVVFLSPPKIMQYVNLGGVL